MIARSEEWLEANQRHLTAALGDVRALMQGRPAEARLDEDRGRFALDAVTGAFALTPFERNVLLLCAGIELDSSFAALCAEARGDAAAAYPTFSLALAAFPDAHWSAVTPAGALRRWRLIEVADSGVMTRARLRIDERVLHFLTGIDDFDERLAGIIEPSRRDAELVPSHAAVAARAAAWCRAGVPGVQLCGADQVSRRLVAASIAEQLGASLAIAAAHALPSSSHDAHGLARLWDRDAVLSESILLIECESPGGESGALDTLRQFTDRLRTPFLVSGRERRSFPGGVRAIDLPPTAVSERRRIWEAALGDVAHRLNGEIDALATHFRLSPAAVRDSIDEVAGLDPGELGDALWQSCRARTRQRIDELARRIDSRAHWDDLVLPPAQLEILRDVAGAVRYRSVVYERWGFGRREWRGLGVSALFCGPSGTGKTLAAEILANELKLDLYAVDLSGVVSKYIGETEKNLRRIFDAAEEGGAILLFDEADALFGKRSEVRDSHDRYANIEVSYLLQRMEAYRGIAILTTNLRDALDTAFLRRLRFVVQFPFPGAEERERIWRRMFPPELPVESIDAAKLAQLNIAGGNIRNVALSAAFLAARDEGALRMTHLLQAARAEYVKLERTLNESEVAGWA